MPPGRAHRPQTPALRAGRLAPRSRGSGVYAVTGGRPSRRGSRSLLSRRARCSPSSRNSTADATTAGSSEPSVTSYAPSRSTAIDSPGISRIQRHVLARRRAIAGLHREPVLERLDDTFQILDRDVPVERRVERLGDEPLDDPLLGRLVAGRLELDLADRRGDDRAEVGHAGRRDRLAESDGALERGGLEHLGVRHRDAHADPGALADLRPSGGRGGSARRPAPP